MHKIIGAAAFVAMVLTALPASAQGDFYDYPYCLQGRAYGYGVVLFHKLPAMPGFSVRDSFLLWHEPSICVRMAAARSATLSNAVIVQTRLRHRRAPLSGCAQGDSGRRAHGSFR
jgi:hypothetical protein